LQERDFSFLNIIREERKKDMLKLVRETKRVFTSRVLIAAALFLVMLGAVPAHQVNAATTEISEDGIWKYTAYSNGKECSLVEYLGADTVVTIPQEVDGFQVDTIETDCFLESIVTKVTIPASLSGYSMTIEKAAFNQCPDLKKIIFTGPIGYSYVDSAFVKDCNTSLKLYYDTREAGKSSVQKLQNAGYSMVRTDPYITMKGTGIKHYEYSYDWGGYYYNDYLNPAKTLKLKVTVHNLDGYELTYKTNHSSIATVSKNGTVKGIKAGSACITVTASNGLETIQEECYIYVRKTRLSMSKATMELRETWTLSIVYGNNSKAKWKSSNTKVAKVSAKGKVQALKPGKATITATIGKKKYKCTIKVKKPYIADKELVQYYDQWSNYCYVQNDGQAKIKKWWTSNKKIATVNAKTGKVTPKRVGGCYVYAKLTGGVVAKGWITVLSNYCFDGGDYTLSGFDDGTFTVKLKEAYFKKKKLVVKLRAFNLTDTTVKYFSRIKFCTGNCETAYKYNVKIKLKPYTAKTITLKFSKDSSGNLLYKNVNLRSGRTYHFDYAKR
jgi:hypothetical protein